MSSLRFEIESHTRGGSAHEHIHGVTLSVSGTAWSVHEHHWRFVRGESGLERTAVGAPAHRTVQSAAAARCLADGVRRLVRGGMCEQRWSEDPVGDHVVIDRMHGYGGRSLDSFPKVWSVGRDPDEAMALVLDFAESIRVLR
jgi:hypothetical protein